MWRRSPRLLSWSAALLVGCAATDSEPSGVADDAEPPLADSWIADDTSRGDADASDSAQGDAAVAAETAVADTAVADGTPAESGLFDTGLVDTGKVDAGLVDTGKVDAGVADTKPDTGFPSTAHVHIYITNTCAVSTSPTSFDVPTGATVKVAWHNHSVDYRADVWASYGGGYLALERGATWNEPYEHCFIKSTHTEYVDVTPEGSPSSCGKVRVYFYCHG